MGSHLLRSREERSHRSHVPASNHSGEFLMAMCLRRRTKIHHDRKVNSLPNKKSEHYRDLWNKGSHQVYKNQVLWPPQQSEMLAHKSTLGFLFFWDKDKKKEL